MENEKIKQIRMNALVAEHVYSHRLTQLNIFKLIIDVLTIILPILVTSVLLVIKGTAFEAMGNIASILLSALLLGLVVFSLLLKFEDKKTQYQIGRKDNIYVANEALKLLSEPDDKLNWFYTYIAEMDSRDSDAIGAVSEDVRQEAYRKALMKLVPGSTSVVCPVCFASPFKYIKGLCQVCGNSPQKKEV